MNPLLFFLLTLKASLFSSGGMANLPSLHDDLTPRGWATEQQFAESLAVGNVSPGPNGLWVVSLGYLLDGVRGALLATFAIILPPLLALAIDRLYQRVQGHPAVVGFLRGLSVAVGGVFAVTLAHLIQSVGVNLKTGMIVLMALGLGTIRRVPILAILFLAAVIGMLWRP